MPGLDQPPSLFSPSPPAYARGALVCVVGASGGVGASSVAAATAQQLGDMAGSCVLAEWDCGAGGIEVLLAMEAEPGARWPQFHSARGQVDGRGVVAALPRWRDLPVLSSSREAPICVDGQVMADVFSGLVQAGYVVVVDVPASALPMLAQASSHNAGPVLSDLLPLPAAGASDAGALYAAGADAAVTDGHDGADASAGQVAVGHVGAGQGHLGQASAGDSSYIAAVIVVAATSVQSAAGAMAVTRWADRVAPHAATAVVVRQLPRSATSPVDIADLTGAEIVGLLREDRSGGQAVERGEGPRLGRGAPLSRVGAHVVAWLGDVL